jgi:hypothetical protein
MFWLHLVPNKSAASYQNYDLKQSFSLPVSIFYKFKLLGRQLGFAGKEMCKLMHCVGVD